MSDNTKKKGNTARIPEGKKRVVITLENDVVDTIQKIANKNMRTVSNEIALLIKEKYMNTKE
ncbi:MAG: ribbon-helix-helix domain-containing protein [Clostridium paraputrificum]|uniref:ribbon-helix-helix domain-containing protein n=1 Tax=Clostridium paraputrificum TaxID=29363 RepID=UPI000C07C6FE|nr:hypothetical protein [Clostridium paraputrificum]